MPNYFVAIYQQGGKLGLNFPKIKILVLFSVENKKLPCVSDLLRYFRIKYSPKGFTERD